MGLRHVAQAKNVKSIEGMEHVREKIKKEVREGRVLGPFQELLVPNFRVSPLGIVTKKHCENSG